MARFSSQAIPKPKVQIPLKQRESERTQGPPSFLQDQPTWPDVTLRYNRQALYVKCVCVCVFNYSSFMCGQTITLNPTWQNSI